MKQPAYVAETLAIPRQMARGILFILALMVVVAAIAVRVFPSHHAAGPEVPTKPLPERIAPVGTVQVGAADAAAPGAPAAAAPAAAAPAAPAADKPAAKEGHSAAPSATTVAAAPAAAVVAPAAAAPAPATVAPADAAAVVAKAESAPMRINGRLVYQRTCAACHANGIAGAPRTGDVNAWGPRIAAGTDALLASALNGKGAMPPKGGNAKLSDGEVKAALEYMLNQFASR